MSTRTAQIRALVATTLQRYEALIGGPLPLPLPVADMAEQVFGCSAFADPTLDPAINGELNAELLTIRFSPGLRPTFQRFVVAHELGHLVLDGTTTLFQDDRSTLDERAIVDEHERSVVRVYNAGDRQEQDANMFALELLVPAHSLWQAVQQPGWTVAQLAATFGVSQDALRTQLINVCCLDPVKDAEATAEPAAITLDAEQYAAITAPLPALVVAGPGTGKTRALVAKYAALVESGVDPATIVVLTFSNGAADELRTRIVAALDTRYADLVGRIEVSTFHAWGYNFLKQYGTHVGLPLDVHLRTRGDLFLFLLDHLDALQLEQFRVLNEPRSHIAALIDAISRAKDELRTPDLFRPLAEAEAARTLEAVAIKTAGKTTKTAKDERALAQRKAARLRELADVYERYEALLQAEGIVDYGDLILLSVAALRIPDVAREAHARYAAILVDEFQDINYASGALLALLDGGRGCVWAVGDPWQSIYRFRGASAANLAEFPSVYPSATMIPLARNYRSTQPILDASASLMIADPLAARRSPLQAQRHTLHARTVQEWDAPDQDSEYAAIAHNLLRRVGGRTLRHARCVTRRRHTPRLAARPRLVASQRRPRWGEHAILCRKHSQVAAVVGVLEAHGIPVVGGGKLLGYPEVKDILAICTTSHSLNDVGVLRALTVPEFRLDADDLEQLVRNADAEGRSLQRAMRDETIVADLSPEGQATLERLRELHDELGNEHDVWRAITRYAFDRSPSMRERIRRVAQGDARARRELTNIGQLATLARTFVHQALPGKHDAPAFAQYVRELIAAGDAPKAAPLGDGADAVHVITIHAAKGLEWDAVYVPGVQKGIFPSQGLPKVVPDIGGLAHGPLSDEAAEERYLLYVAMTRARERLVLSRTSSKGAKELARSVLLPSDPAWPTRHLPHVPPCFTRRTETRLRGIPLRPPLLSASGLRTYKRCPRQYMYQYGFHLRDEPSGYLRMHGLIQAAVDQLTEWMQEGKSPVDDHAITGLVRGLATRHQLAEGTYAEQYIETAITYVQRAWRDLGERAVGEQQIRQQMVVEHVGTRISVRVDRVETSEEGTRYIQFKTGRLAADDHRDTPIVLYALAAQAHHPGASLAIHYLLTNETHAIDHRKDRFEGYVEKLDELIQGINAESWEPNFGRQCETCPFNLICPV